MARRGEVLPPGKEYIYSAGPGDDVTGVDISLTAYVLRGKVMEINRNFTVKRDG